MAKIALAAVGAALGGAVGGSVLGLSMATIGQAAGAAIGRRIDQQVIGGGSAAVEGPRIDRFRLTGATEGADVQQVYGRMRIAGQVIWASQFKESTTTTPGTSSTPTVTTYHYSLSLALALCEGEVSRIGRIWADGSEISPESLNIRLYSGTMDQLPDPKISATEGAENTPAYRGTAYVVIEDMALDQFENRIPQLTFEVICAAPASQDDVMGRITGTVLAPAAGGYSLATSQLFYSSGFGAQSAVNTNTPLGGSDFSVALDAMVGDLPRCGSVVLPVIWYGDDLRCGQCKVVPMARSSERDPLAMSWSVSGWTRDEPVALPEIDGLPIYGGSPTDEAVKEAIAALTARGLKTVLQPRLLMTQQEGNALTDPYGLSEQPTQPWCGLITTSVAPTLDSTVDGTAAADAELAAFFGLAELSDFSTSFGRVDYTGPSQGGYRRFILHYAKLCAVSGGVDAFCIGTDLAGLTCIRGADGGFPAVTALQALAADVRSILGSGCQISYAADGDEFCGYTPEGTKDRLFPLDALWSDPNIDCVGVNARWALADWRDGESHLDAQFGSIYNQDYLTNNVAGGRGFDWQYENSYADAAQIRTGITDTEGEPWVWRSKDLDGWWSNVHYPRVGGIRQQAHTSWVPRSKPIWLMQVGCAAVDKGANQVAPYALGAEQPPHSNGTRDDLMQVQYLRAVFDHYGDDANNPVSDVFNGRMIDGDRIHALSWEPRPYPFWPGNQTTWTDGQSYATGTALNGRASNRTLASVVAQICQKAGVRHYDISGLFGIVRGYVVNDAGSARQALQPLMLAYGFDAMERDGVLVFRNRQAVAAHQVSQSALALDPESDEALRLTRGAAAEIAGRVKLAFIAADGQYDAIATEAIMPDEATISVTRNELPLALTRDEGADIVTRWLQEARVARDTAQFALPPSRADIGAGDVVALSGDSATQLYRIDRIDEAGVRLAEATRVDAEILQAIVRPQESAALPAYRGPSPAELLFLDLPLLTGDEIPHAPYVAAAAAPWSNSVALYGAAQDSDYALLETLRAASVVGVTETALGAGPVGIWDRQAGFEVSLVSGAMSATTREALLAGANTLAIGTGAADGWEVLQFQSATPAGAGRFEVSQLLRGQFGTWGLMPATWPVGSKVVLLNGTPQQINLPSTSRGTARHFRFGPAQQPLGDPSYRYASHVFEGNGLRPYPVAHLRAQRTGYGAAVDWIRATRIDGDLWGDADVPLGEDTESYRLRIVQNGTLRREVIVGSPTWSYDPALLAADVGTGAFNVTVAQLSSRFGAGPKMTVTVT